MVLTTKSYNLKVKNNNWKKMKLLFQNPFSNHTLQLNIKLLKMLLDLKKIMVVQIILSRYNNKNQFLANMKKMNFNIK